WYSRNIPPDEPGGIINAAAVAAASAAGVEASQDAAWVALAWGFHYDDVPQDVVDRDLAHYQGIVAGARRPRERDPAPWNSYTTANEASLYTLTPGIVAPEAAAITVPVLS